LENAIEPYRRARYVITSQTDSAITLRAPVRPFSWALFLTALFLLWPVAVVYLIRFNQRRDRSVCVRITSQGQIEASGFTLDLLERERQPRPAFTPSRIALFLLILGVILGALFLTYVGINNS
jgi:hypothetical protein